MKDVKVIPDFSQYGVTSTGQIFNLVTGKRLSTTVNRRGYHQTTLVNDAGERKGVKRHRLVALAHLGEPPTKNSVVNHKDLIPGNDWKDNLEWCTQKRNTEHWVENDGAREVIPVEVFDVRTGDVVRYKSASECARQLGFTRTTILDRISAGPELIWPEGRRYRDCRTNTPWPTETRVVRGRAKEVVLKDLITGRELYFDQLTHVLPYVKYKLPTIWTWANNVSQPVVPGLFQIQLVDRLRPWREVIDPFDELQEGMHIKVVIVTDADWKNPVYYESAIKCSDTLGIRPTALNYRLKLKGQTVFDSGKRYCYYSDLTEEQKKTIRYEVLKSMKSEFEDVFNGHRKLHPPRWTSDTRVKSSGDLGH